MAKAGVPRHDPVPIGDVATPAFVRLPEPARLFEARSRRFAQLAEGHELRPYLLFLAGLSAVQHQIQAELPEPDMPDAEAIARAREFGMPPLDRGRFTADPASEAALDRLLGLAPELAMPAAASKALARVTAADAMRRDAMVRAVLDTAIPVEALADHTFVAAALQVHFARMAAHLDAKRLVPVGDGVCPVCGGAPTASMVVGWLCAHGARYCGCGLCGTLWNYVRIKCTLCASTGGIAYQEIDGGPGTIKAETCTSCYGYVKILQQQKDPNVDIIADDVASLGLDLLVRETGFRRGGVNPFLLGY
jgi:FdhE protein